MICTNVPGPNIPLYVLGKRLLATYPKVPVVLEMGINFAIASYDQRMFVNICADGVTANDAEKMGEFLDASFEELLAAAEVKQADYVRIRASAAEAAY
jgi:hypothetical protein